jgi:acetylornithine deacetylase/succinyl-diaminopimelate desuccinylase-like protein
VDGRFLPGYEDEFFDTLAGLVGENVSIDWVSRQHALETTFDGDLVDAISSSILDEDPGAKVAPYLMSGGTDAKHWKKLGIRSFGFAPLRLPADLDFTALFHGVDERVPVDALEFGARVFDRFLDRA